MEFEEFRTLTLEDMLQSAKAPNFDDKGMFIAELAGKPVGVVNAYIDKERKEKKGFIRVLGVAPEHRRKGIGRKLADKAIDSLKKRGIELVETGSSMNKPEAIKLWESMGFKQVRVFSLMTRSLSSFPSGIGENKDVTLRKIKQPPSEADIRLVNQLENETFSEHYNFRPATVEETTYFLTREPTFREQEWLIAYSGKTPVGYVGVGIDRKYNTERKTKAAWIMDIGVLKTHRLKGVGTRLMLEGMQIMKIKGMTEALLGVDDQNPTKAIKLYEKVGYQVKRKDIAYQKTI
jgi:mycothiol synthase